MERLDSRATAGKMNAITRGRSRRRSGRDGMGRSPALAWLGIGGRGGAVHLEDPASVFPEDQGIGQLTPWLCLSEITAGDLQAGARGSLGSGCLGLSMTAVTRVEADWEELGTAKTISLSVVARYVGPEILADASSFAVARCFLALSPGSSGGLDWLGDLSEQDRSGAYGSNSLLVPHTWV